MCNGCVPLAIGIQFSTFVGVCLRQLLCLLVVGSPAIRFRGFPDFGSCICVVFSYWAYPGFCFFPPGGLIVSVHVQLFYLTGVGHLDLWDCSSRNCSSMGLRASAHRPTGGFRRGRARRVLSP